MNRPQALLILIDEFRRFYFSRWRGEWIDAFKLRLQDASLSGDRRWVIATFLWTVAKRRGDTATVLEVWSSASDLVRSRIRNPGIAILVCEAAAWAGESDKFDQALACGFALLARTTKDRLAFLRALYLERENLKFPRSVQLPVPLPHDSWLPYVDYYARARAADSEGHASVALNYYQEAVKTLPRHHNAYQFAMGRCNEILNSKS